MNKLSNFCSTFFELNVKTSSLKGNYFIYVPVLCGARCSSVVRAFAHYAMGLRIEPSWWTQLAISPRLVQQRPLYVLSCLWDDAFKRTLTANRKEKPMWRQQVFLSDYLSGPLTYV